MSIRSGRPCVAAVVLLAGTSLAIAQGAPDPGAAVPSTTGMAPIERPYNNDQPSLAGKVLLSPQNTAAHDPVVLARDHLPTLAHTFNFTDKQKHQIRDALAPEQGQTVDLQVEPGTELSQPIETRPIPDAIAQQMPWVGPYRYAKLGNRIVIVDPNMPVVVSVIE